MEPLSFDFNTPAQTPQERVAALRTQIRHHQRLYYEFDAPEIPDGEFDALFRELVDLERQHPHLSSPDSPTQRVGGAPSAAFAPVRHRVPMLSIENAMTADEAASFVATICDELKVAPQDLILGCEPKYDGLSCNLTYENGLLARAATRGDGEVGEDVTAQVKTIQGLPLRLPKDRFPVMPAVFEVRGEVVMPLAVFAELNEKADELGEDGFVNPRNAAAGGLRQKDPEATRARKLAFLAYGLGETSDVAPLDSQVETIEFLRSLGFAASDIVRKLPATEIEAVYKDVEQRRDSLPWQIDGTVFKVDSARVRKQLGWNSRTPRWAIAYKFPPEEMTSRLVAIDLQVGRTGVLTPVARIQPVMVGGAMVSNATLHNLKFIQERDIRVGDEVTVFRAGDVIPRVVPRAGEPGDPRRAPIFSMPSACPVCGSPVAQPAGRVAYTCSGGFLCKAQRQAKLEYVAGRDALDIEGLAGGRLEQLVEEGLLKEPADLYRLDTARMASLEGWGAVSLRKLQDAIDASRRPQLAKFIYALGIPGVGRSVSKELVKTFPSLDALMEASEDDLRPIKHVGPIMARAIRDHFTNPVTLGQTLRLAAELEIQAPEVAITTGVQPFKGKTFVVTGTLSAPREQIHALIEAAGGTISGSVSAKTSVLVAGEAAGSKMAKAKSLNVDVWDESRLRRELASNTVVEPESPAPVSPRIG